MERPDDGDTKAQRRQLHLPPAPALSPATPPDSAKYQDPLGDCAIDDRYGHMAGASRDSPKDQNAD